MKASDWLATVPMCDSYFAAHWEYRAESGQVDAGGSSQYRRALRAWNACRRPAVRAFLLGWVRRDNTDDRADLTGSDS